MLFFVFYGVHLCYFKWSVFNFRCCGTFFRKVLFPQYYFPLFVWTGLLVTRFHPQRRLHLGNFTCHPQWLRPQREWTIDDAPATSTRTTSTRGRYHAGRRQDRSGVIVVGSDRVDPGLHGHGAVASGVAEDSCTGCVSFSMCAYCLLLSTSPIRGRHSGSPMSQSCQLLRFWRSSYAFQPWLRCYACHEYATTLARTVLKNWPRETNLLFVIARCQHRMDRQLIYVGR